MRYEYGNEFDREPPDDWEEARALAENHFLRKDRYYGSLIAGIEEAVSKLPDEDRYYEMQRGLDVIEGLFRTVNENGWSIAGSAELLEQSGKPPLGWHHQSRPHLIRKKRLEPYILREEAEGAASDYLRLPYRTDALDRIFVDLLIAAEMFAYADEMQPVLKRRLPLLLGWLVNNLVSVVVGCAIAGAIYWLFPNSTTMNWVAIGILGFTLLGAAYSLVVYPFIYPTQRKAVAKVLSIIEAMLDAYSTLAGRPTSTKHLEERVLKGTDVGVVWPAPLIVLVEDIRARRSTI